MLEGRIDEHPAPSVDYSGEGREGKNAAEISFKGVAACATAHC